MQVCLTVVIWKLLHPLTCSVFPAWLGKEEKERRQLETACGEWTQSGDCASGMSTVHTSAFSVKWQNTVGDLPPDTHHLWFSTYRLQNVKDKLYYTRFILYHFSNIAAGYIWLVTQVHEWKLNIHRDDLMHDKLIPLLERALAAERLL